MVQRGHETAVSEIGMNHYRYIGDDDFLVGKTALGRMIDGVFKVQVDRFDHPWSHYWHESPEEQWEKDEA